MIPVPTRLRRHPYRSARRRHRTHRQPSGGAATGFANPSGATLSRARRREVFVTRAAAFAVHDRGRLRPLPRHRPRATAPLISRRPEWSCGTYPFADQTGRTGHTRGGAVRQGSGTGPTPGRQDARRLLRVRADPGNRGRVLDGHRPGRATTRWSGGHSGERRDALIAALTRLLPQVSIHRRAARRYASAGPAARRRRRPRCHRRRTRRRCPGRRGPPLVPRRFRPLSSAPDLSARPRCR